MRAPLSPPRCCSAPSSIYVVVFCFLRLLLHPDPCLFRNQNQTLFEDKAVFVSCTFGTFSTWIMLFFVSDALFWNVMSDGRTRFR
ncbi:hypothetical protein VIGAN_04240900 [Vigna angularis var. angularis]|uniref:Uncharacterized protein n=1 Tax=Vigna angularis var. angularis TaxID=157739 RepID=A0A0S3RWL7_PHAAN|nr:hypothetical protein VIGAN_04240900 [Vigna angularis var. angularis]